MRGKTIWHRHLQQSAQLRCCSLLDPPQLVGTTCCPVPFLQSGTNSPSRRPSTCEQPPGSDTETFLRRCIDKQEAANAEGVPALELCSLCTSFCEFGLHECHRPCTIIFTNSNSRSRKIQCSWSVLWTESAGLLGCDFFRSTSLQEIFHPVFRSVHHVTLKILGQESMEQISVPNLHSSRVGPMHGLVLNVRCPLQLGCCVTPSNQHAGKFLCVGFSEV